MKRRASIAILLCLSLIATACGGGFASNLRAVLAASTPMIDALPISPSLKSGLVVDFKDLAQGAANLKDDLDACSTKACKLDGVNRFQRLFWDVQRRGHFGSHPKLEKIELILRGIIDTARAYYGAVQRRGVVSPAETEKSLKAQIEALKREMEP